MIIAVNIKIVIVLLIFIEGIKKKKNASLIFTKFKIFMRKKLPQMPSTKFHFNRTIMFPLLPPFNIIQFPLKKS
jgi:hypothetical protein